MLARMVIAGLVAPSISSRIRQCGFRSNEMTWCGCENSDDFYSTWRQADPETVKFQSMITKRVAVRRNIFQSMSAAEPNWGPGVLACQQRDDKAEQ